MKKKNRIHNLNFRGIINVVVEHQGNVSFVQNLMYMVEFYPNTCTGRMINGNKEPSTGNSGYQRGN